MGTLFFSPSCLCNRFPSPTLMDLETFHLGITLSLSSKLQFFLANHDLHTISFASLLYTHTLSLSNCNFSWQTFISVPFHIHQSLLHSLQYTSPTLSLSLSLSFCIHTHTNKHLSHSICNMALGKVRTNKRSSGTSYTSTVTTVVFVALCVLGVWMLTSNSVVPPQTNTRTATTTGNPKFISKRDAPIYEDTPGDLPEDAIKSDEPVKTEDTTNTDQSQEDQQNSSSENSKETEEAESNNNEKQESEPEPEKENSVTENNREVTEQENVGGETKNDEENVLKQPGDSVVHEENPQGSEGKESAEEVSNESSKSQNQQADESTRSENQYLSTRESSEGEENQKIRDDQENKVLEETQTHEEIDEHDHSSQYTHHHHASDEDQQQQLEHQRRGRGHGQGQDEEHSQEEIHEGTSHDQIEHDEAPVQSIPSNDDQNSQETTHDSNPEVENQETKLTEEKPVESNSNDSFPGGENSGIPKESKESKQSWSTQADQSENQKERRKGGTDGQQESIYGYTWQLCNVTAGTDYIPCLDNEKALRHLHSTKHYEHRERHCPEEPPTCLVSLPEGYKTPVVWPQSRDKIWYHNVPHTKLAEVKGHQNWVKVTGEFLTFPGGGTQFIHGALHYIDFIQEAVPAIAWGIHTRVVLDVGCGVASFGGYLFDRDVLAISFAPKDEHEAQVQFALERGIPAISAVMGSKRLPFPSRVFDLVHCARCRVPWHAEGGALLLELNRVLRPGGHFVWSATPVYQTLEEDVQIWKEMSALTAAMCWDLVTIKKDKLNSVGAAVYRKPISNECYDQRKHNQPPMCKNDDDPNAAWYVPLQSCMHQVPVDEAERGSRWPEAWPSRLQTPPYWLNRSQVGIYGKPAPEDFAADYKHWKRVVKKSYLSGLGISWANVRNIMDMRAVYGGFAAAMKDLGVWVLNVVNIDSPDTLPIIYERGLFGIYHDWCESFSTYPRTYDLLHADHLFSMLKKRCKIVHVMTEIDRIVRPGGKLIVRDESSTVGEVENLLKSLHWEVHLTFSKNQEGILSAQKSDWRPDTYAASS